MAMLTCPLCNCKICPNPSEASKETNRREARKEGEYATRKKREHFQSSTKNPDKQLPLSRIRFYEAETW